MKNLLFILFLFCSLGQLDAQFYHAFGEPGLDFRTTQIKTLNGDTYVSGWFFDSNVAFPGNTEQGALIRLDADGFPEWVYRLSSVVSGNLEGTRIYDFDFSDDEESIVFVGSTNIRELLTGTTYRDSGCTIGMINLNSGTDIFQQSFNFRGGAREIFLKIINDPDPNHVDNYYISGNINDPGTGPGQTDNYIGARAEITPGGVNFVWINEYNYQTAGMNDQEMARMRVLEVGGQTTVAFAGIDDPGANSSASRNEAHINFHDNLGAVQMELILSENGTILDMAQMGNLLILVGQLRENLGTNIIRPFITGINVNTGQVVVNSITFPDAELDRFSRVELESGSNDIMVVAERAGQNSAVLRFRLAPFAGTISYIGNTLLDFGNDEVGNGLLAYDANNAYWADTRSGVNVGFPNGEAVATVVRTTFNLNSCESNSLLLTPQPIDLTASIFTEQPLEVDTLDAGPLDLQVDPTELCPIKLCGPNSVGIGFTTTQVNHGSNAEYVTLVDFDQDGWQDFAVPDGRFNGSGVTPQFSISENNQNLTFNNFNSLASNPSYTSDGESMEFIQLDNARGPDIVLHRQGRFEVYLHQGGTDFSLVQTEWVTSFAPPNTGNLIGVYRSDFDLVDHTGDQIPDLVITGATTGGGATPRIAVFPGINTNSAPFFDANAVTTMPGLSSISYWETIHKDLNADGHNDLLTGQAGYNGTTQSIFGYLNTSSSTAPFPQTHNLYYETPSAFTWPRGIEVEDLNGNGQSDLIATMQCVELVGGTPTGNGALILARDVPTAAGSYTAANLQWQIFNIPGQPVGLDVGDIDSDGDLDVVVAVHYPNSFVRVYENNGNGNFTNFADYPTWGGRTTDVQITDFNEDCCKDIVTAQWHGNSSYILVNDCEADEFVIHGQVRCEDSPCNFLGDPAPNQVVSVTNGGAIYYGVTDPSGNYQISVPAGTYDVALVNGNYGSPTCAATPNVYANDAIGISPGNGLVNFAMESVCELDVNMIGAITGTVGANTCPFLATPCEDLIWEYCIEIENNTCSSKNISGVQLDLPHGIDPNSIVINSFTECGTQTQVSFGAPSVTAYTGGSPALYGTTVTYPNVNAIGPGECFTACLDVTFTTGLVLPVNAAVDVFYDCDRVSKIETDVVSYQDTCSCDPNLKLAYFPQGCGSPEEILDEPIEYTIQFSNIGQSPAYNVLIEDQLDANLDWSTFQWLGSSHTVTSMSLTGGLLSVEFATIVLPPAGTGWIEFSVKPLPTTTHQTVISNAADITFDSNAPVSTNTVTTEILFPDVATALAFDQDTYCVGEDMYLEVAWTGDAAWINTTQNGNPVGQQAPAPASGTQTAIHISDFSYVGTWEYELIAIDSLTGCTDTSRVTIVIEDCVCEDALNEEPEESFVCEESGFRADAHFDLSGNVLTIDDLSSPNPSIQIVDFGDGTQTVYNPAQASISHTYTSPGYYLVEYRVVLQYDDGSCCVKTLYYEFVIEGEGAEDGGEDGVRDATARIYPNPATGAITVQSTFLATIDRPLRVELYTAAGRLLEVRRLRPDHDRLQLDLTGDYEGLLFLRVLDERGTVLLDERFVRMKE